MLLVQLDYSRSPLWIACCSFVTALQCQALPLPPWAEMTVMVAAISALGEATHRFAPESWETQEEKQPPLPASLP